MGSLGSFLQSSLVRSWALVSATHSTSSCQKESVLGANAMEQMDVLNAEVASYGQNLRSRTRQVLLILMLRLILRQVLTLRFILRRRQVLLVLRLNQLILHRQVLPVMGIKLKLLLGLR